MDLDDLINPIEPQGHFVEIKDIRVCIFSRTVEFSSLGTREVNMFCFAYPYKHESGGLLAAYNPIAWRGVRKRELETKEELASVMDRIRIKTLRTGEAQLIWDGPILIG